MQQLQSTDINSNDATVAVFLKRNKTLDKSLIFMQFYAVLCLFLTFTDIFKALPVSIKVCFELLAMFYGTFTCVKSTVLIHPLCTVTEFNNIITKVSE